MMILDQWWWFAIPGIILGLYAQFKLMSTYSHYVKVGSEQGITGAQAARAILDRAGMQNMPIHEVEGQLTDHYDPTKKALFLSSENFHGTSLAAIGVSAHEAGHALQHQAAYAFMQFRMALVPITQIASTAVYGIILLSFFMHLAKLAMLAVLVFAVIALFQLITLPVEFDASRRARVQLLQLGLISQRESLGVRKVLNAAAMTYVAAMVASLMQLLHWVMIARGSDDD